MKHIFSVFFFALTLLSVRALGAPTLHEGVDISPLLNFLKPQVVRLEQSVTIYNWSTYQAVSESETVGLAQFWSQTFWEKYGTAEKAGNMFGGGLYGAVDPVVTSSYYGGGPGRWFLIEMKLPVGMRLIDLKGRWSDSLFKPSAEFKQVAEIFGCPTSGNPTAYFESGGHGLSPRCQGLVRKIYKDILKIDGIIYDYNQASFQECSEGVDLGSKAFVILDGRWMKPELINYFFPTMTGNLEGRIRLQTLFLKAMSKTVHVGDLASEPIAKYLTEHPDSELKGSQTKCDGSTCTITIQFCAPQGSCEDLTLDPLPRPGGPLITLAEAKLGSPNSLVGSYAGQLLWTDLEGKPKAPSIKTWLKENKYACDGKLPFTEKH